MKAEKLREKIRNKKVFGWKGSGAVIAPRSEHVWLRRFFYSGVVFVFVFTALAFGAAFYPKVREVLHGAAGLVENFSPGVNDEGAVLHGAADLSGSSGGQIAAGDLYGAANGQVFKDVPSGSPAARAISYLKDKGYLQGFGDGTFRPSEPMTRAALLVLISKIRGAMPHPYLNSYCFKDVKEEWFAPYVCSAKRNGLVSGESKYFRPEENITRAEAIKIIVTAFEKPAQGITQEQSRQVSASVDQPWYAKFLETSRNENWLWPDFTENTVQEPLTRGEAAIMLYNVVSSGGALK